ncbi:unnamed protein product [Triticum turgidum subsp. durum]|uniref:Uncharacterized protein n=1 Tax=Triticum turgidum subsp. durum TaxID=4567 RepID=A0A9R0YQB1_TRITD|nr:unnamed protein product [Triticum turgidum subsp. durum]
MEEKPALGLGSLVSSLRVVYKSGRTRELSWRRSQLKGLIRLLTEKEEEIFDALHDDLGKHRTESFRDEVGVVVKSIKHTLQNLEKWAAPEKASPRHSLEALWTAALARHDLLFSSV